MSKISNSRTPPSTLSTHPTHSTPYQLTQSTQPLINPPNSPSTHPTHPQPIQPILNPFNPSSIHSTHPQPIQPILNPFNPPSTHPTHSQPTLNRLSTLPNPPSTHSTDSQPTQPTHSQPPPNSPTQPPSTTELPKAPSSISDQGPHLPAREGRLISRHHPLQAVQPHPLRLPPQPPLQPLPLHRSSTRTLQIRQGCFNEFSMVLADFYFF